ncbi:MAG: helix-turn-helix domain-containing protein [Lachnospiraceae bacterium]
MNKEELLWLRRYNQYCGKFMYKERCRRGISEQKISRGVCTRTELRKMENGDTPWKKMIGDYLLQRLGVPTEYFEVMADARELNGWRDREDICLVVFEQPQKAQQLLEVYQKKYRKKTPFEEQFLKKMQTILLMQAYKKRFESKSVDVEREKSEGENLVESARQTVLCTLPDGWEKKKLSKFLLAPCELESILLLANCLLLIGKTDEAMQMHKKVADYVKQAKFEPKVQILIYPQVALLGMKLELYAGNEEKAFSYGMEALELLRHQYSQRYVVFVLEELLNVLECISVKGKEDQKYKEEETEVTEFLKTFEELYRLFSHPKKRMWQSISVSNTHEIGLTLKMLRKAMGLSAAKVSAANPDHLTARQIEKIEAGTHRPSGRNYEMLMQFYHKTGLEGQLLLETDSLEVLHQRQEIVDFIIREEWDNAWESFQSFKEKLDVNVPLNRQEMIFLDTDIQHTYHKKLTAQEYVKQMEKALYCTMPKIPMEKWNMWVFQREEAIVAGNIAGKFLNSGESKKAEELFSKLLQSFDMQMEHTRIPYRGYVVITTGLVNALGENKKYYQSIKQDERSINVLLNDTIEDVDAFIYDICWSLYELVNEYPDKKEKYQNWWRELFPIAYKLAEFFCKKNDASFYEERVEKYLGEKMTL